MPSEGRRSMGGPVVGHEALFRLDDATVRCPFDALDDLRLEPVRYVPPINAFVVSGHAHVVQVLSDPELFSSRNPTGPHSATAIARRVQIGEIALDGLSADEQVRVQALARR